MAKRLERILPALLLGAVCVSAIGQTATADRAAESRAQPLSQDQLRALIRQAVEKDLANEKQARDYTYLEREEKRNLDGNGRVKSTEIRTHEIMILYDEPVARLVAKDDKALAAGEAAKEDARIQKLIDKRKNESEEDRRKRLEKQEKEQEENRQFETEIGDAYNFRLAGMEEMAGRAAYVIDADPRPGFEPHLKDAKFLPKFRFRVWIDQASGDWAKINLECIDTASVGLFLARIHKGSNIHIEQVRVNDEVWLPKHIALQLDARVLLFKGLNLEEDVTYRDYRKFRADTRIVPAGTASK
ncbi:MAG TPA: hypothetical protein VLV49_11075 [Terriglobales bacterium]|nr:hypothetical protein [Terriglobales bacterium]